MEPHQPIKKQSETNQEEFTDPEENIQQSQEPKAEGEEQHNPKKTKPAK
jgi:hypothetical protein